MAFIDKYDFQNLKNEAERQVFAELERQLGIFDKPVCLCNECVVDMAALALNMVKPLYRVSLLGSLYTSHALDQQTYAAALKEAVSISIEKVRKNPSHDGITVDLD